MIVTTTRFRNFKHVEYNKNDSKNCLSYVKDIPKRYPYWIDLINPVKQSCSKKHEVSSCLIVNLSAILLCLILTGTVITDFKFNEGKLYSGIKKSFTNNVNVNSNILDKKNGIVIVEPDDENIMSLSVEADLTQDAGNELATLVLEENERIEIYNSFDELIDTIYIDNVVNLHAVDTLKNEGHFFNTNLLMVESEYDESIGAYTKTKVCSLYACDDNRFIKIWSGPIEIESSWNLKWNEKKEGEYNFSQEDGWVKLSEKNTISFLNNNYSQLTTASIMVNSYQKYEMYDYITQDYIEKASRNIKKTYVWDDEEKIFINSKKTISEDEVIAYENPAGYGCFNIPKGTEVIILEKERDCSEALIWDGPFMFKIQLPDGKRCFIEEKYID